jgi:hypothetical protein
MMNYGKSHSRVFSNQTISLVAVFEIEEVQQERLKPS